MGGVRRQAVQLFPRVAHLLQNAGGSLTILASRDGLPPDLEDALPTFVTRLPSSAASGGALARALSEPRALKSALDEAKQSSAPYDLVHTGHLPVPGISTPFSLMLHDLRDLEKGAAPIWRRAAARHLLPGILARAAAICTVSNTMVQEIGRRFPANADRVHLIPHGCDHLALRPRTPSSLSTACADLSAVSGKGRIGIGPAKTMRDDRPPILYLGHLERRKNLDLLLDTMVRDPGLPHLLIVGLAKHGEDHRLAARARELGLQSRVCIFGPIDEVELPRLLATSGCMVLPSRIEGFGIPVLEAHRAGLPLAVARASALPEAAAPGTPNFSPDNPEECALAIRAALSQGPGTLQVARDFAARFTWENSANALFSMWKQVALNCAST
jgi:glycosyltransferase involved in cell wall biosynthesis